MAVDVLQAKIRKLKNPTMVCICPTIRELPLHIKEDARHKYGQTLRAAAEAYKTFSFGILDALKDTVPAVSVISGAFSALGADGVAAMQEVLSYAASLGYYVLLDLMRADLGTTAEDLANACFGKIQVGEESFTPTPATASHEWLSGKRTRSSPLQSSAGRVKMSSSSLEAPTNPPARYRIYFPATVWSIR